MPDWYFPEAEYRRRALAIFKKMASEVAPPPAPPEPQSPDPAMDRFRERSAFNQTSSPPPPAPPVGSSLVPTAPPADSSPFNQPYGQRGGYPVEEEPVTPPLGGGFGQAQQWGRQQQVGPPAPAFPMANAEPAAPDPGAIASFVVGTPLPFAPYMTTGQALEYAQRPQQALYGGQVAARDARAEGADRPEVFNRGIEGIRRGLMGEQHIDDETFLSRGLGVQIEDPTARAVAGLGVGMVFDPANALGPAARAGKIGKAAKGAAKLAKGAGEAATAALPGTPVAKALAPETVGEPWLMDAAEWGQEVARLEAQVRQVVGPNGVPQEHLTLWRQYQELVDNAPAAAQRVSEPGALAVADPRLAAAASNLPDTDLIFVRRIAFDERGDVGRLASTLTKGGYGSPDQALAHGHTLGDGTILFSPRVAQRGLESAPGQKGLSEMVAHEVGHTIYDRLPARLREQWESSIHPGGKDELAYARHAEQAGEYAPTAYGSANPAEDFAETYRLFRLGGIDAEVVNPGLRAQPGQPITLGPARQAFMSEVNRWLGGGQGAGSNMLPQAGRPRPVTALTPHEALAPEPKVEAPAPRVEAATEPVPPSAATPPAAAASTPVQAPPKATPPPTQPPVGTAPPPPTPPTPPAGSAPMAPAPPPPNKRIARLPSTAEVQQRIADVKLPGITEAVLQIPGAKTSVGWLRPWAAVQTELEAIPKVFAVYDDVRTQIVKGAMSHLGAIKLSGYTVADNRFTKGVTPRSPGASLAVGDVLEFPARYDMPDSLRTWIKTLHELGDEALGWAKTEGLKFKEKEYPSGAHYVGRVVREVRDVVKRRAMDPGAPRHYDTMEQGIQSGVRYEDDLMAIAQLGLDTMVRKIVAKRMGDLVKPLGRTRTQLLDPAIVDAARVAGQERSIYMKYEETLGRLRTGESPFTTVPVKGQPVRLLRPELKKIEQVRPGTLARLTAALKLDTRGLPVGEITPEILETYAKLKGEEKLAAKAVLRDAASRRALDDLITEAVRWREEAVQNWSRTTGARRRELGKLQSAEWAEGANFGLPAGTIGVGRLQKFAPGRLLPIEAADFLNREFKNEASEALKALNTVSGASRAIQAGFDVGTATIHLLGSMASHPIIWGKAFASTFEALLDPRVYHVYLSSPKAQRVIQRLVPVGLTLEGVDETAELPALFRGLQKVTGGKVSGKAVQSRMEAAFHMPLNVAKIEMADALLPAAEKAGEVAELAAFLNHATGTLSTKAMGIGANQRAIETGLLFFSPRYTRASIALVGDALGGGIKGGEARKQLGSIFIAMPLMLAGAKLAMGQEVTADFFNPASPRFLEVEVFGQRVSFGGFHLGLARAIAQAVSKGAEGKGGDLLAINRQENPLVRFPVGRTAPLTSLLWDVVEGRDFLGEPVKTPEQLARRVAKTQLPFALQDVVPGDPQGLDPRGLAPSLLGLRTMQYTDSQERNRLRDQKAQEQYGKPWAEIGRAKQEDLRRATPALGAAEDKAQTTQVRRDNDFAQFWADVETARKPHEEEIARLNETRAAGKIDGRRYREEVSRRELLMAEIPKTLKADPRYREIPLTTAERQQSQPGFQPSQNPADQFIEAYYGLAEQAKDPDTGLVNVPKLLRLREELEQSTPPEVAQEALGYIRRNRDPKYVQAQKEYRQYRQLLTQFDLTEDEIEQAQAFGRKVRDTASANPGMKTKYAEAVVAQKFPEMVQAYQKQQYIQRRYGKHISDIRKRFLAKHPLVVEFFMDAVDLPEAPTLD